MSQTAANPLVSEETRKVLAEWNELAAKHPTPTYDDIRPGWAWVAEHGSAGTIDPEGKYAGLHVAIYQQRVIGGGPEPIALQARLARELGIHPARMVVTWLGEYE